MYFKFCIFKPGNISYLFFNFLFNCFPINFMVRYQKFGYIAILWVNGWNLKSFPDTLDYWENIGMTWKKLT